MEPLTYQRETAVPKSGVVTDLTTGLRAETSRL